MGLGITLAFERQTCGKNLQKKGQSSSRLPPRAWPREREKCYPRAVRCIIHR